MTDLIRLSRYNREIILRIRYAPAYGWRSLWRVIRGDLGFDPPIKRQGAQFTMTEGQQHTVEAAASPLNPLDCCGDALYWCPTAQAVECGIHSGFTRCCDMPELHRSIPALVEGIVMGDPVAVSTKPLTAGYVIDAGGGQVGVMVDRSTMEYPTVGTRVVLYEFTVATATFRCGHGRLGTERCAMCDAGVETEGVKCTSGDHLDEPAAGDAWNGDEDQPDQRVPYCAECLAVLGEDFGARWWEGARGAG
jgi:hypothetical protein